MLDLILAAIILFVVSAVLFFLARLVALRSPRYVSILMAAVAAAFIFLFSMLAHGKLVMAQWLPLPNVIVLGNGLVLGMAVIAGVAVAQQRVPKWRRLAIVLLLTGLAGYSMAAPFLGSSVAAVDHWTEDRICLQSCAASCSPASAATLLAHHKIPTSEVEMAALCLTREEGTPSLGVFRGLKLKARQSPWRVEVVRGSVDELLRHPSPALLRIRLDDNDQPSIAPWAWSSGIGHAVVCFGISPDGRIEIGDPAIGRVQWTRQELQQRWRGEGLRLVPAGS